MTKPDNADGPYSQQQTPKEGGSVIHKDIQEVKDRLNEFSVRLSKFKTVGMEYEIDTEHGRIRVKVERALRDDETMEEAHEELYKECLRSVAKIV